MDETGQANWMGSALDAAIEDALRTAPLEATPPGLYPAVMRRIDASSQPAPLKKPQVIQPQPQPFVKGSFRVSWLDLALSLFGAGMLFLTGVMWNWLPAPLASYFRMQLLYSGQVLVYRNTSLLVWCSVALAALIVGLLAGLWSCLRLGICQRKST